MPERSRWVSAGGLVLAGVLIGMLLIQPVGAHFTQSTKHLGIHAWKQVVKDRVYTRKQIDARTYTRKQIDARIYTREQADARFVRSDCPGGITDDVMVKVGTVCIDAYEASLWDAPVGGSQIIGAVPCEADGRDCTNIYARSLAGAVPRADITWFQAQQALANSGKRLPTNAEWQMAAVGTPEGTDCRITGGSVTETGVQPLCFSRFGAFDMVGNLWEWVADWVPASEGCREWVFGFSDDAMCLSGASATANEPGALLRGGGFSSGSDAGPFAVDGRSGPPSSASSIGFRGAR